MEKKAIHIQHNAHLVPARFREMLITSDVETIKKYKDSGYLVSELNEEGQKELADYDGKVVCYGDIYKYMAK